MIEKLTEWNENPGITWWKEARIQLNKIIRKYNKWIDNDTMNVQKTTKLLSKIKKDLNKNYANQDGGSGYKEELEIMYQNVKVQLKEII